MALDNSLIVVNLRDNSRLSYNGGTVKMKGTVLEFSPINDSGQKEISIRLSITYYISNAGAYGATVLSTILADNTLSVEEKENLLNTFDDRTITYYTGGNMVDASGNIVPPSTNGAIPEKEYWQNFQLNQVAGVTGMTMSAMGAVYAIITAFVNKLNQRKKW